MSRVGKSVVDVHAILRASEEQKQVRAEQFPNEQDCIRMGVQLRLRLKELGWREAAHAPKDGSYFESITLGFTGPTQCCWLGRSFFVADGGDLWPQQIDFFRLNGAKE